MDPSVVEALADCLERMAGGMTLEECLRAYPAARAELESLLRASAALRAWPDPPALDLDRAGRAALARAAELRAVPAYPAARPSPAAPRLAAWFWPATVAALLALMAVCLAGLALLMWLAWPGPGPTPTPTATPAVTQTTAPTRTPTQAATATHSATPSLTPTLEPTQPPTASPTWTASPTQLIPTPSGTAAATVNAPPPPTAPPASDDDDDDDDDGDDDDG